MAYKLPPTAIDEAKKKYLGKIFYGIFGDEIVEVTAKSKEKDGWDSIGMATIRGGHQRIAIHVSGVNSSRSTCHRQILIKDVNDKPNSTDKTELIYESINELVANNSQFIENLKFKQNQIKNTLALCGV